MKSEDGTGRGGAVFDFYNDAATVKECEQACLDRDECLQILFSLSSTNCALYNNKMTGNMDPDLVLSTKIEHVIPRK